MEETLSKVNLTVFKAAILTYLERVVMGKSYILVRNGVAVGKVVPLTEEEQKYYSTGYSYAKGFLK